MAPLSREGTQEPYKIELGQHLFEIVSEQKIKVDRPEGDREKKNKKSGGACKGVGTQRLQTRKKVDKKNKIMQITRANRPLHKTSTGDLTLVAEGDPCSLAGCSVKRLLDAKKFAPPYQLDARAMAGEAEAEDGRRRRRGRQRWRRPLARRG